MVAHLGKKFSALQESKGFPRILKRLTLYLLEALESSIHYYTLSFKDKGRVA
jgi:hypothetical protein